MRSTKEQENSVVSEEGFILSEKSSKIINTELNILHVEKITMKPNILHVTRINKTSFITYKCDHKKAIQNIQLEDMSNPVGQALLAVMLSGQ